MNNLTFKLITSQCTWPLRHSVLRADKPLSTCKWDGDDLPTTYHYAICDNQLIIGIASLFSRGRDGSQGTDWQLRGMAVDPERQGQNLGGKLLEFVLNHCRTELAGQLVWCNARKRAVNFYLRHGFEIASDEFEIPEIGPHFVMQKTLQNHQRD